MNELQIPITTDTDLRGHQYKAVDIGGTLAIRTWDSAGLVQTRCDSGEEGSILLQGRSRFVAGGAITRGARVQVTSGGFCTAAASGDLSCGIAEITVTSGSVGRGVFNFVTLGYQANSSGA